MEPHEVERRIVIGTLYSEDFLKRVRSKLELQYFEGEPARAVLRVVLKLWDTSGIVLGDEFPYYISGVLVGDEAELAKTFFESIQPAEKHISVDALTELAFLFFARRSAEILIEQAENSLATGNVDRAVQLLENYTPPRQIQHNEVDIFGKEVIEGVFQQQEPLFTYNGELGAMLNPFMKRSSFVAILAPEKRGKSWFLIEFAMKALKAGHKVLFIEAGDMSTNQLMTRFFTYITGRPIGKTRAIVPMWDCELSRKGQCGKMWYQHSPAQYKEGDGLTHTDIYENGYRPCSACAERGEWFPARGLAVVQRVKPLTRENIEKLAIYGDEILGRYGGDLKVFTYPANTLRVSDIAELMRELDEQRGWQPDVVVIDYADILAPELRREYRH